MTTCANCKWWDGGFSRTKKDAKNDAGIVWRQNAESSDASDAFAATICSAVRPESLQKTNATGSK
jgi:hypothetical protein